MKIEYFHNFNNEETKSYIVAYQRQGNDRNGNPIYIVNIFDKIGGYNINYQIGRKLDKYSNIKLTSYNIENDIQHIINNI